MWIGVGFDLLTIESEFFEDCIRVSVACRHAHADRYVAHLVCSGHEIYSCTDRSEVCVWGIRQASLIARFDIEDQRIFCFSAAQIHGKTNVLIGTEKHVFILDARTRKVVRRLLTPHAAHVESMTQVAMDSIWVSLRHGDKRWIYCWELSEEMSFPSFSSEKSNLRLSQFLKNLK